MFFDGMYAITRLNIWKQKNQRINDEEINFD